MADDILQCPGCGEPNLCQFVGCGTVADCWCFGLARVIPVPLVKEEEKNQGGRSESKACFCRSCLEKIVKSRE